MRTRWLLSIAIVILALISVAPAAHAVCTNPNGAAGSIVFNKDHQVMQYCDDTNWIAVGRDAPEPCPVGIVSCGGKEDERVFFVTDAEMRGNIGGISGADSICQSEAEAANLQGTYLAWLTDSNTSNAPASRFEQSDVPYVRVDGTIIANDWSDLVDGSLAATADLNPFGLVEGGNWTFTNTLANGTQASATNHCSNFTSGGGPTSNGDYITDTTWGQTTSLACSSDRHLYCFEQGGAKLTSVVPDGLVGYWRLDETYGSIAKDSSGNGNDGTYGIGIPPSTNSGPGVIGNAIETGPGWSISTGVLIPANAAYDITGDVSLSAWVYMTTNNYSAGIISYENSELYNLLIHYNSMRFRFSGFNYMDTTNIERNQWIHVGVVKDSGAKNIKFYKNGTLVRTTSYTTDPVLGTSAPLRIGNQGDGSATFEGYIDDVRVYNRTLSDDEFKQIFEARDANLRYDADRRVPKYFNGDDWVAMGPSKYVPNAVHFDPNEHLNKWAAASNDTKAITGSFWIKSTAGGLIDIASGGSAASGLRIQRANVNKRFVISGLNTAGSSILNMDTTSFPTVLPWTHILFSFDLSDPTKRHIYVNDVDSLDTVSTFVDDFIEMNDHTFYVGSRDSSGGAGDNEYFADFWLAADTYIDLSIEANRRKFIDEYGDPVFLGADGSLPTSSAPDIFLSGDTDSWHVNKGTGGGFTEGGALEDAITKPGGPFLPADGLVGYWKLDEVSGSTVIDYASANNGTYTDSDGAAANVKSQGGVHGGALDFSGHRVALGAPDDLDFSGTNAFTISAWVKPGDTNGEYVFQRGAGTTSNGSYSFWRYPFDQTRWQAVIQSDSAFLGTLSAPGTVNVGEWALMTVTWDGTNLSIYENGVQLGTNSDGGFTGLADNPTPAYQQTSIGSAGRSDANYFNGSIDDVAVYDRALSPAEITGMYNAGICANPERLNGAIIYNVDFNVMQYCDAVRSDDGWQAVGP